MTLDVIYTGLTWVSVCDYYNWVSQDPKIEILCKSQNAWLVINPICIYLFIITEYEIAQVSLMIIKKINNNNNNK